MKAGILVEAKKIEVTDVPMVTLQKDTEVIVKVMAIGICGTDLHVYRGERQDVSLPRIMGHELAGIVVRTGEKVKSLREGDHVIFDPVVACHTCTACKKGHENICESVKCFGVQMDGGFQEYISVEEDTLYKISKEVPFTIAALGEPFSIAANIFAKSQAQKDDYVVIIGAGTVGIAVLQVMKKIGCKVMVADISEKKLENAARFGADVLVNTKKESLEEKVHLAFAGNADVVLDAVGSVTTLESAVKIASPCGRVIVIGFDTSALKISPADITKKELKLLGSRMNNRRFPQVVKWLEDGTITDKMISKQYNFRELNRAFQDTLRHQDQWLKTIIVMEDENGNV